MLTVLIEKDGKEDHFLIFGEPSLERILAIRRDLYPGWRYVESWPSSNSEILEYLKRLSRF